MAGVVEVILSPGLVGSDSAAGAAGAARAAVGLVDAMDLPLPCVPPLEPPLPTPCYF